MDGQANTTEDGMVGRQQPRHRDRPDSISVLGNQKGGGSVCSACLVACRQAVRQAMPGLDAPAQPLAQRLDDHDPIDRPSETRSCLRTRS